MIELIQIFFSMKVLPNEIVKIILYLLAENSEDQIYLDLEIQGFSTRAIVNAQERKKWHQWAEKFKFHHFGYIDKSKDSETSKIYKCPYCNRWQYFHVDSLDEVTCCNANCGNTNCGNSYHACNDCDHILLFSSGNVAEGVKEKSWARNNMILFMKTMDYSRTKRVGLTKKAIKKVLLRRSLL